MPLTLKKDTSLVEEWILYRPEKPYDQFAQDHDGPDDDRSHVGAARRSGEMCRRQALANKGSYILTFKAYGHNEKCSGTTSYQVPGGNEASMDVVSGHTVEITGAACNARYREMPLYICMRRENSCENLVCDGFFPENLKCHRK